MGSSSEHGNVSSGCVRGRLSAWIMDQQLLVYFKKDFCDFESCSKINLRCSYLFGAE